MNYILLQTIRSIQSLILFKQKKCQYLGPEPEPEVKPEPEPAKPEPEPVKPTGKLSPQYVYFPGLVSILISF